MSIPWTHLRRLVASVMLVAMTSFVLHGGSLGATHRMAPSATTCGSSDGHVHHAAAHDHGGSAAHHHHHQANADAADGTLADDAGTAERETAAGEPCCSSVCFVALSAQAPVTGWSPGIFAASLRPDREDGPSAFLDGLKRPPRTTGIG